MNNPRNIDDKVEEVAYLEEMTQQPAAEVREVETAELEQVAGGGDGTVLGTGRL